MVKSISHSVISVCCRSSTCLGHRAAVVLPTSPKQLARKHSLNRLKRSGEKVAIIYLQFQPYRILYVFRFRFYLRDPLEDFVEPLLLFERRSVRRWVTHGRLKGLQVVKDLLNAADNLLHRLLTDPADRGCVDFLALLLLAWRRRWWLLLLLLLVRRTSPGGAVNRRSHRRCRPRRWRRRRLRRHRGLRRYRLTLSLLQLLLHRWRTMRHLRAGGHARGRGGCEGSCTCGGLLALRRLLLVILRT